MAKLRSPNYPNRNLEASLGLAHAIYSKDGRNKISRAVLASHMGHEGVTGPALGKIGALRAYGIIEGAGDELRISDDAVAALMAPLGSDARRQAIRRLALNPTLFQDIRAEFPGKVSAESLTYWLIQNGFQPKAAPLATQTYFETMEFAGGVDAANTTATEPLAPEPEVPAMVTPPVLPAVPKQQGVGIMDGERVAFTEEGQPGQYLKLFASGEVDDGLLEALEDYVKRQRKRLKLWYGLTFTSDQAEQEVTRFASMLKSKFEEAGMPSGCLARRHQAGNGDQIIILSPEAAALAAQIPSIKPLLQSVLSPADPNNIPGYKPMGIFA